MSGYSVILVKASEVAQLIAKPRPAPQDELIFGKIFEEEVTYAFYLSRFTWRGLGRDFARKIAARMRAEGVYTRERMVRAYRMYAALRKFINVPAKKPRTRARAVDNVVVFAQPDLELTLWPLHGCWYAEFKTYPIDEYARAQAKVFSFVLDKPVLLLGLVRDDSGYYSVQYEVVDGKGFKLPEIPEGVGRRIAAKSEKEACRIARRVAQETNERRSYRYYFRYWEEEEWEEEDERDENEEWEEEWNEEDEF